jgi:hypothetical protein
MPKYWKNRIVTSSLKSLMTTKFGSEDLVFILLLVSIISRCARVLESHIIIFLSITRIIIPVIPSTHQWFLDSGIVFFRSLWKWNSLCLFLGRIRGFTFSQAVILRHFLEHWYHSLFPFWGITLSAVQKHILISDRQYSGLGGKRKQLLVR